MSYRNLRLLVALATVVLAIVQYLKTPQAPVSSTTAPPAATQTQAPMPGAFSAQVVGVHDGDTLTVLTPTHQRVKVRMAQIDAPELAQPYGQKAKQALSGMVFSQTVTVQPDETDRYGRTVATVWVSSTNVNRAMVQGGHVWVYRSYLKDTSLLALEGKAKAAHLGLWALPESQRTPPWLYRRSKK